MGAGSSTEQRSPEQPEAGSATPVEPEPSGGGLAAEAAPSAPGDPAIATADPATKLLQKNGQLSSANGLAEEEEFSPQEGALNGQEEEAIVTDVGQRESEDVSERASDKATAAGSVVVQDMAKDGQEEMPEIIDQIPSSESNLEELIQPTESQANDVGFKKVFKFVGFKFTVKKDKTEKSDTVQLLTVKKDEGEGAGAADGAGDHQEPSQETGEATAKESELKQSTEKPQETLTREQSNTEIALQAESGQAAEEHQEEGEEKQKEPTKSPDSPTSPVASETASPFKKFFTQGWAGWRKKTSFRKPKEEKLEASEKKKDPEPEKVDTQEQEKTDAASEKVDAPEQAHPQEITESVNAARLSVEYEKVELPSEDQALAPPKEKPAPLATEVFDDKVEIVADVHVSMPETKTEEEKAEGEETVEPLPDEKGVETQAELEKAEPAEELGKMKEVCAPGGDHAQPTDLSPEDKAPSAHPEGAVSEVDVLSSQERMKVQGSPLKKLFTSTGLKKLSGKKQKGKREGGDEELGEHHQAAAESPDSTDEQKGESSASSPEEPEEITCLEKGIADAHQEGEAEEGTISDGEKKREGVTPWASFKKMVTPKKRVRRLSESDKEDELDKVKSATLSSTESAASEMQEEAKGNGEEQKPEEPKRKVDTSVSWEALICVGSSKKRARKASSSDDEGELKTMGGDSQKPDDAGRDKDTGPDSALASSQEHDQGPGSSSPEQAGSPTEGEGVSTWESFKRLVTPRKKSKSKLEEKSEDSVPGSGTEHSASDVEPGKEESWVSIKKFIPGRRKKRSDGKAEQATVEDAGPAEVNEDDSDVPAVVPLSEYDAVEREKTEAQQAQKSEEKAEQEVAVSVSEELSTNLVHGVTATVLDGARAVSSVEERSPSWISASVTEPLEETEDEAKPLTGEVFEEVLAEETSTVTKTLPEGQEAIDDTVVSEAELTWEAVTAAEGAEAFCAEEAAEASGAEETADMVSAVSQLTDSPADTTEEATPVQEVEGGVPDLEDQERRTQEVLQAVAEKVREESLLPEDTIQTVREVEAKIPEKVEEAEEDSQGLDLKKETDGVLEVRAQEAKAETLTQGEVVLQATPESFEKVPPVTDSVESSELRTTCQAETLVGVKSELILGQAIAPDSAETLTDSETNGSTPVADLEALHVTQQEQIPERHEDTEVASGTPSQVPEAEAVPAPEQVPPAPASFPSQEENKGHSEMEEVLEHPDKEIPVETVPILSKTDAIQEEDQFTDRESQEKPLLEGPDVSADPETTSSQEATSEVALKEEATREPEFQKDDGIEVQSPTPSPEPVEREMEAQGEREEMEAKPTQATEEELEQKPAVTTSDELSKQLVQTESVAVIGGEKEVTAWEESSPQLVQEEAVCTEVHVQSSEAPFTLTAAAVEEKVLGQTVEILETTETLESADAQSIPEEESSEKDEEALTARPGDVEVPTETEAQPESIPVTVAAAPDGGVSADLEDETTLQSLSSHEEDGPATCQEVQGSETRKEDLEPENEISKLETESSKLVQNVIQTVVGQLVSTEEAAADFQTQAQPMISDTQEVRAHTETEEELQAQDGTRAKEESTLTTVEQTHSDIAEAVSEASAKVTSVEVERSSVDDQQLEEAVLPSEEKEQTTGTESVLEDGDRAGLEERIEESLPESQEDEKGDAVDEPENQHSALEDAGAPGGLGKESPDTDGPTPKEKEGGQEVEFQEGKVHSESEEEIKTQTQDDTQKQEGEPAKSEPTGS
ncbi:A-kinase anchor protein 12 isoform X1 [Phoca vitulina]|uniref:A-kinase anchor protein 12 isoform X1 n=1 Tax=Phoca vitulina TaxID=9720 RepID=UPI0013964263|nr:A-kinase anchor protein 12 isoform X1 [Phoca vitulina]XP_032263546.1 A-kinase anchor protein 12 isoform X1 [Phoca vitulina]